MKEIRTFSEYESTDSECTSDDFLYNVKFMDLHNLWFVGLVVVVLPVMI